LHAVRCSPYYAQCEDRKRVKTHYCPLPWQTYSEARKRCHRDWLCSAADYPYFNEHADLESQKGMNTAEQIVDFLFAPFLGRRESADMVSLCTLAVAQSSFCTECEASSTR
jgi:hypothetical protein